MKTKRRKMPAEEFYALCEKIHREVPPVCNSGRGAVTNVWMVDGDFMPTQNLAEVRWIMTDNVADVHLFQVDATGDAILLERER